MSVVLYVRISETSSNYLRRLAEESGLPLAKIADEIIAAACDRGWSVTRRASLVIEPSPDRNLQLTVVIWSSHGNSLDRMS